MGSLFNEKCNQIDYLMELYEKYQSKEFPYERAEVWQEIMDAFQQIKEWEVKQ